MGAGHPRVKRVAWLLLALALILAAAGPMFEWFFNRMTFFPQAGVQLDPTSLGRPVEEVRIRTTDGVDLHAFFLPGGGDHALLFLHGNAGNASHRLPAAARFADLGLNVLLLDYRGYGLSEGRPSEAGIYRDGEAALGWLAERGFGPQQTLVFGRSLGGAVALDLLDGRRAAGLILCATFSSATDMARRIGFGWAAPLLRGRLDSMQHMAALDTPFVQLHGDADDIVPLELGRKLFSAAPEGLGRFVTIEGVGHNDIVERGGVDFWNPVSEFLAARREGNP